MGGGAAAVHGGTAEMEGRGRTSAPGDIDKFLKARGTRYVPIAKKRQQNADHKVRAQYKKLKAKLGVSGPRGQAAEPSSEPDSQLHPARKRDREQIRLQQSAKVPKRLKLKPR